uniref:Putative salivary secreted protein n=1 Tax=Ixodes scapularis TaxID=6945 RepID=A0A4D5RTF0_IXOSC
MMIGFSVLFLAFIASAYGASIKDSNDFLDHVLLQKMPALVRRTAKLYPNATIGEFKFTVERTGIKNRELKVKMKQGAIRGFDTGVHRVGDSGPVTAIGFDASLSCTLDFSGINATFMAKVEGDNLLAKDKRIPITVNVVDTVGRFEAMSSGRLTKVRTFHIDKIRFNTQYDKQLNLNAARRSKFIEEVEKKVNHELYTLLYNDYLQLLNEAVAAAHFPRL